MHKTISERLFEDFCSQNGIRFTPIPRPGTRTPDYDFFPTEHQVVAELKQIDPNDDDLKARRKALEEGRRAYGGEPGKRVRQEILDARKQLRQRAKNLFPSALVIYNNVDEVPYTDPMFILLAMYGQLVANIRMPEVAGAQPCLSDLRFGGKRTVTEEHNTSISAVALLYRHQQEQPALTFYHNCFAAIPFEPDWLRLPVVRHYTLAAGGSHGFEFWEEV